MKTHVGLKKTIAYALIALMTMFLFMHCLGSADEYPTIFVDVRHYDIKVIVSPADASMVVTTNCTINIPSEKKAQFALYLNRSCIINEIELDGEPVHHVIASDSPYFEANKIYCISDNVHETNQKHVLKITTRCQANPSQKADPDWMGIILIRPDEFRFTKQSFWYPMFPASDELMSFCKATASIAVRAPSDFSVLSLGHLSEVYADGAQEVHVWKSTIPSRYSVIGRKYELVESFNESKAASFYSLLPDSFAGLASRIKNEVVSIRDHYEIAYGPALTSTWGIAAMSIQNPNYSYNYSTGGYVVFPESYLAKFKNNPTQAFICKLAHEIAHCWFPCSTSCRGEGWRFFSEGTAEYMAREYVDYRFGAGASSTYYQGDLTSLRKSEPKESLLSGSKIAYTKGPWVLKMLNEFVDVQQVLKRICHQHKGTTFTSDDFWHACQLSSRANLDGFRRYWYEGVEIPSFSYDYQYSQGDTNEYKVTASIYTQSNLENMHIPFRFITEEDAIEFRLPLSNGSTITFETNEMPYHIVVDPDLDTLAFHPILIGDCIHRIDKIFTLLIHSSSSISGSSWKRLVRQLDSYLRGFYLIEYLSRNPDEFVDNFAIDRMSYSIYLDWVKRMDKSAWPRCQTTYSQICGRMDAIRDRIAPHSEQKRLISSLESDWQEFLALLRKYQKTKVQSTPEYVSSIFSSRPIDPSSTRGFIDIREKVAGIEKVKILDAKADGILLCISTKREGDRLYVLPVSQPVRLLQVGHAITNSRDDRISDCIVLNDSELLFCLRNQTVSKLVVYSLIKERILSEVAFDVEIGGLTSSDDLRSVYCVIEDNWGGGDIVGVNPKTGKTTSVLTGPADQQYPSICPNGTLLAYSMRKPRRFRSSGTPNLHLHNMTNGVSNTLGKSGRKSDWSTDGRYLSYVHFGNLHCLDTQLDKTTVISESRIPSSGHCWRPGTYELYYMADELGIIGMKDVSLLAKSRWMD